VFISVNLTLQLRNFENISQHFNTYAESNGKTWSSWDHLLVPQVQTIYMMQ